MAKHRDDQHEPKTPQPQPPQDDNVLEEVDISDLVGDLASGAQPAVPVSPPTPKPAAPPPSAAKPPARKKVKPTMLAADEDQAAAEAAAAPKPANQGVPFAGMPNLTLDEGAAQPAADQPPPELVDVSAGSDEDDVLFAAAEEELAETPTPEVEASSDVLAAELLAVAGSSAAKAQDVEPAEEEFDILEIAPASGVQQATPPADAAPSSDVLASELLAMSGSSAAKPPTSDVLFDDVVEVVDGSGAQPASANVLADDVLEVTEASGAKPPSSNVLVDDVLEEVDGSGAQPASANVLADDVLEVMEASGAKPPGSSVLADDVLEVVDGSGAQPASPDVLADEIMEIVDGSGAKPASSNVLAEEVLDVLEDSGAKKPSAVTEAEAAQILGDAEEIEEAQDVEDIDLEEITSTPPAAGHAETIALEPPSGARKEASEAADVLDLTETMPVPGSSAAKMEDAASGVSFGEGLDQTMAFSSGSDSGARALEEMMKPDAEQPEEATEYEEVGEIEDVEEVAEADEFLEDAEEILDEAEEEVADDVLADAELVAEESSAVDLGKSPASSKPLSGFDPLAESLESGVRLDQGKKSTPADDEDVIFDDVFEDAAEVESPISNKKTPPSAEAEDFLAEEIADEAEQLEEAGEVDEADLFDEGPTELVTAAAKKPEPETDTVMEDEDDLFADVADPGAGQVKGSAVDDEILEEEEEAPPAKGKGKAKGKIKDEDDEVHTELLTGDDVSELEEERPAPKKGKKAKAAKAAAQEEAAEDMDAADLLEDQDAETVQLSAQDLKAALDEEEADQDLDAGDILLDDEDDASVPPAKTKGKGKQAAAADEEAEEFSFLEEDDQPAAKAGKNKHATKVVSAGDLLLDEEEEETPVSPKAKGKGAKTPAKFALAEEEPEFEEEEEYQPRGRGRVAMKKPPKPKYGRRWLGGMFLGLILAVGGVAATRYFAPDKLTEVIEMIPTQNEPPKKKDEPIKSVELTLAQKARVEMDKGNYGEAAKMLAGSKVPEEQAALGEAIWLDHLTTLGDKKAPTKDDPEVVEALKNLSAAKRDVMVQQIEKVLAEKTLRDSLAGLKDTEKVVAEVREALLKAKVIDDKTEPKELSPALGAALDSKQKAEEKLAGLAKALVDAKFFADPTKLDVPGFEKLLKDLADAKGQLVEVNKLLDDVKIKDAGPKGVGLVLMAKKDVEERIDAINKILEGDVKDRDAKGLQKLIDARNALAKDRETLDSTVKAAFNELVDAKILNAKDNPRAKLVDGLKIARQKAESPLAIPLQQFAGGLGGLGTGAGNLMQRAFNYAELSAQLNYYRAREPLILTPEKKLETFLALVQDRGQKDGPSIAEALEITRWLLSKEAQATPHVRGQALLVTGLLHRNREKFDAARKDLKEAARLLTLAKDANAKIAQEAEKELTEPTYFLALADKLQAQGKLDQALAQLELGLKALPGDARLQLFRGLVRLEQGRGKLDDASVAAIRKDMEPARKDELAAAHAAFALGLLEEAQNNFEMAENLFDEALKSHKGPPEFANRYRLALARVLQRERTGGIAPVPEPKIKEKKKVEPKKEEKKDEKKDDDKKDVSHIESRTGDVSPLALDDLQTLFVLALTGVQLPGEADDENPAEKERVAKSVKILRALIDDKDTPAKDKGEAYLLLGQALAKQGKRTEGLKEYIKGLELLLPGAQSKDLAEMVARHPAFSQPDIAARPNPFLAEQFYGKGLHLFWERKYSQAETAFKKAVELFGQDARYQYFLGLAQLNQRTMAKRSEAEYSFEQGARLEAVNRPTVAEVNLSLERIQGGLRDYLNGFRQRALVPTP
jgi:cellobiose-specific phosphotransferase system component IIA